MTTETLTVVVSVILVVITVGVVGAVAVGVVKMQGWCNELQAQLIQWMVRAIIAEKELFGGGEGETGDGDSDSGEEWRRSGG